MLPELRIVWTVAGTRQSCADLTKSRVRASTERSASSPTAGTSCAAWFDTLSTRRSCAARSTQWGSAPTGHGATSSTTLRRHGAGSAPGLPPHPPPPLPPRLATTPRLPILLLLPPHPLSDSPSSTGSRIPSSQCASAQSSSLDGQASPSHILIPWTLPPVLSNWTFIYFFNLPVVLHSKRLYRSTGI